MTAQFNDWDLRILRQSLCRSQSLSLDLAAKFSEASEARRFHLEMAEKCEQLLATLRAMAEMKS